MLRQGCIGMQTQTRTSTCTANKGLGAAKHCPPACAGANCTGALPRQQGSRESASQHITLAALRQVHRVGLGAQVRVANNQTHAAPHICTVP